MLVNPLGEDLSGANVKNKSELRPALGRHCRFMIAAASTPYSLQFSTVNPGFTLRGRVESEINMDISNPPTVALGQQLEFSIFSFDPRCISIVDFGVNVENSNPPTYMCSG